MHLVLSLAFIIVCSYLFLQIENQGEWSNESIRLANLLSSSSILSFQTFRNDYQLSLQNRLLDPTSQVFKIVAPDTTLILLNWSRLSNVKLICSVICGSLLHDIVYEVFVWNNNPNLSLSFEDFRLTGCPRERIRIYNSPVNMYFGARFEACMKSSTIFCFIQDDDYLILPEIIRNINAFLNLSSVQIPTSIHLSPPAERLTSDLRAVIDPEFGLRKTFAWLGYGTYLRRSIVSDFMLRFQSLEPTEEEMKMADNYFSILGSHYTEIWFEEGLELGGGQPFTVGPEGDTHNMMHIMRALAYTTELDRNDTVTQASDVPTLSDKRENVAPCRIATCLFKTNIELLPSTLLEPVHKLDTMLLAEASKREHLQDADVQNYITSAPSTAVDGKINTSFRSPTCARLGDYITLDLLNDVHVTTGEMEIALLVDSEMEDLLRQCRITHSSDEIIWKQVEDDILCFPTYLRSSKLTNGSRINTLLECKVNLPKVFDGAQVVSRFFKATFDRDPDFEECTNWNIHEIWARRRNVLDDSLA